MLLLRVLLGLVLAFCAMAQIKAQEPSILMALFRGETESELAFYTRLQELGINARFTVIDGALDRSKMASQLREIEKDLLTGRFNAIYTYGTPVTQVAQTITQRRVPIIFNIVYDPVEAKFAASLERPGGLLTGASNGVPVATQLDQFYRLKPFRSLAVFFDARAANANQIQAQAQSWGATHGITIIPRRMVIGTTRLDQAVTDIANGTMSVDAVYAGADTYLAGAAAAIQQAIGDKVLLFGGTQTFVQGGWLATYSPAVTTMGQAAAEQMAKILNGADPGQLPIMLPRPDLFISKQAAKHHNIKPPDGAILL